MKRIFALVLALCLCFGLCSVCAYADEGETELLAYPVDGVGTFYFPAGWSLETGVMEDGPFPVPYVQFCRDDVTVRIHLFTQEVYDASGAAMPADVEEYSQRPGPQNDLPEGGSYETNEYGNLSVSYTEDGNVTYLILLDGGDFFATAGVFYPEGTEGAELIPQWMSQADLGSSAEGLQRYDAENVGTFYLPEGWEMEVSSREDPLPQTLADFSCGDLHITAIRNGKDAYEQAGVPIPADVEEYGTRDGVRKDLPEGAEFSYDAFGNYYAEYVQDGTVNYNVLKQGDEAMGNVVLIYPEGAEGVEDIPFWISLAVME